MAIDLQALKDEITLNPVAMPYPSFTPENDAAIADVLNNADGSNPRTVNNSSVDTGDIRGATTYDAFDGLTTAEKDWFTWLTQNGEIPVNDDTLVNLAGIGGTSKWAVADRPVMEPRMTALMQRIGSRAEEISDLLGKSFITPSDVANARNLP
jgi:hypothetical protein